MNMNSMMHNSSQFDKANASTLDGTQMSIHQQFEMKTETDPLEQQHNCMNLALGKPTQSFRDRSNQGNQHYGGGSQGNFTQQIPPVLASQNKRQSNNIVDSIISVNTGGAVEIDQNDPR